jgi:hypothetical protein
VFEQDASNDWPWLFVFFLDDFEYVAVKVLNQMNLALRCNLKPRSFDRDIAWPFDASPAEYVLEELC